MPRVLRTLATIGLAGALLTVTACANSAPAPAGTPGSAPPSAASEAGDAGAGDAQVGVTFGRDDAAVNYNKDLVKDGAQLYVASIAHEGKTVVLLRVTGLVPNRSYGAHVHTKPCGAKPEEAGPHFQHNPDPHPPSTDPNFANPKNEVWLDFTTDQTGAAITSATVEWTFTPNQAGSVVIHAEPTKTAPGQAGTAGARVACVSVGF
jgi:Cu-Zn family superoxide dismutase